MRLEHLAYLIEISKNTSLTSASEHLFITPQALSTSIKTLESELGLALLSRSNKGISLTAHGEAICALARDIMANVEEINRYCIINNAHTNIKGTMRIASSPTGALCFLPKILMNFTARYQNVEIVTAELPTTTILAGVAGNQYDIGLINANYELIMHTCGDLVADLNFNELLLGKLGIICSKHSPVFSMKSISWKKACSYPMILTIYENIESFNVFGLNSKKILPKKMYNYSSPLLCLETISQTDFIGVSIDKCQKYAPDTFRSQLRIVPLEENITNGFYLVSKKAPDRRPVISAFLDIAAQFPK